MEERVSAFLEKVAPSMLDELNANLESQGEVTNKAPPRVPPSHPSTRLLTPSSSRQPSSRSRMTGEG